MACSQKEWVSDEEHLRQFNKKVARRNIPFSGSVDLTHRCNLKCVHCYVGCKSAERKNRERELDADQWISILDQVARAGCLYLLITGGEPLLRKDFGRIYRHAKMNGLLVTVFTNGTLITDRILELFDELPPRTVEISLYGADEDVYENITGIPGSFKQCMRGIRRLMDHRINVKLKTILMTLNQHQFRDMEKMANDFGVGFRFDAAIFPRINREKQPLALRVDPKEAIRIELSDEKRRRQWKDLLERFQDAPATDRLYNCGAGRTMFHVDPRGMLQPCLMVPSIQADLHDEFFIKSWEAFASRIREKKAGASMGCVQCEKKILCGYCPGFFELENGAEDIHSEYLCAMGRYRFQEIKHVDPVRGFE